MPEKKKSTIYLLNLVLYSFRDDDIITVTSLRNMFISEFPHERHRLKNIHSHVQHLIQAGKLTKVQGGYKKL